MLIWKGIMTFDSLRFCILSVSQNDISRKIKMKRIQHVIILLMLSLINGCAATKPGPVPQYTGFLPDYSLLQKGKPGQAERVYIKPDVKWAEYTKILLDPVTLWRGQESQLNGISQKDAQAMADYFYSLIYRKFAQDYEMVNKPSPNTLRFSVAIVKLEEDRVFLETISTIVPQLRLATGLVHRVSGQSPLAGKASVEAKVTDAKTGTLLAEGVDERIGGKTISGLSLKSWGDVENVMKFWVNRSSYNLCVARDGTDCVAPAGYK
jgi:hypothetical protein